MCCTSNIYCEFLIFFVSIEKHQSHFSFIIFLFSQYLKNIQRKDTIQFEFDKELEFNTKLIKEKLRNSYVYFNYKSLYIEKGRIDNHHPLSLKLNFL